MSAGVERFCKEPLVLFLCGPETVFHCLCDVVGTPALDHDVPDTW